MIPKKLGLYKTSLNNIFNVTYISVIDESYTSGYYLNKGKKLFSVVYQDGSIGWEDNIDEYMGDESEYPEYFL